MAAIQKINELAKLKGQVDYVRKERITAESLTGIAKVNKLAELKGIIDQVRVKRAQLESVQGVIPPSTPSPSAAPQPSPLLGQIDKDIATLQQQVNTTSDESQLQQLLQRANQ